MANRTASTSSGYASFLASYSVAASQPALQWADALQYSNVGVGPALTQDASSLYVTGNFYGSVNVDPAGGVGGA